MNKKGIDIRFHMAIVNEEKGKLMNWFKKCIFLKAGIGDENVNQGIIKSRVL